ncbi:hypothetical protein Tco_0615333 [Tanacetum coccineum]
MLSGIRSIKEIYKGLIQMGSYPHEARLDAVQIHKDTFSFFDTEAQLGLEKLQVNYYCKALLLNGNYIAASEAEMEAVWIRNFISGLGILPLINEPIRMFCDNSAALHFANEPGVQKGVRHYHMRYHYVHESIALGEIRFLKVHTYDNLADPFTKVYRKTKFNQLAR